MAAARIGRKSRPERVRERLRQLILGPGLAPGDRLEPMSALATRFGVSVPTVRVALDGLETEGLVVKRQGSGTYVASRTEPLAMSDSVVLCMESQVDVWGELTHFILRGLHGHGRFASLIDTSHSRSAALIHRISHSDASCLVIHGNRHFPFAALRTPGFRPKPVISVVDWEPPPPAPEAHLILADYRNGARQAAEHLIGLGHRRALVVGSAMQVDYFLAPEADSPWALPRAVREEWERVGGCWQTLASVEEGSRVAFPTEALLGIFGGAAAPTAIVGLRDVEALAAQRILNVYRPELAQRIAFLGFYDTPWALVGEPPITTVHLDLESIAAEAVRLVDDLAGGRSRRPVRKLIPPRLIVRGTSVSRPKGERGA